MVNPRKKICLLVCGSIPGLENQKIAAWLNNLPELNIIAAVESFLVFNKNSANIGPAVWLKLAAAIKQKLNHFNGFVVLHDLDQILFTSAALSFLLPKISRPVVFASSQGLSPASSRLETKTNLINAAQVASLNFNEVGLIFGNRLLRANQAEQDEPDKFRVPESGLLGRIDFSIRIFEKALFKAEGKTKSLNQLNDNLALVYAQPLLTSPAIIRQSLKKAGLIINLADYQKIPEAILAALPQISRELPVVLWWPQGNAASLLTKNIILINNLTWPTAVVKLMWALGQTNKVQKIKDLLTTNIAGEFLN